MLCTTPGFYHINRLLFSFSLVFCPVVCFCFFTSNRNMESLLHNLHCFYYPLLCEFPSHRIHDPSLKILFKRTISIIFLCSSSLPPFAILHFFTIPAPFFLCHILLLSVATAALCNPEFVHLRYAAGQRCPSEWELTHFHSGRKCWCFKSDFGCFWFSFIMLFLCRFGFRFQFLIVFLFCL